MKATDIFKSLFLTSLTGLFICVNYNPNMAVLCGIVTLSSLLAWALVEDMTS